MKTEPGNRQQTRIFIFASQIFAGLDGIENRLDPGPASDEAYTDEREFIPKSLQEAVESLRDSAIFQNKMGKLFVDYMIKIKESEISRYMDYVEKEQVEDYENIVTEWEHREYFENF